MPNLTHTLMLQKFDFNWTSCRFLKVYAAKIFVEASVFARDFVFARDNLYLLEILFLFMGDQTCGETDAFVRRFMGYFVPNLYKKAQIVAILLIGFCEI